MPHPIQKQRLWSHLHFSIDHSKLRGLEIYFELTVLERNGADWYRIYGSYDKRPEDDVDVSTGELYWRSLSFADEFVDMELQNYRCGWSWDARLGGSIPWSKLGSGFT